MRIDTLQGSKDTCIVTNPLKILLSKVIYKLLGDWETFSNGDMQDMRSFNQTLESQRLLILDKSFKLVSYLNSNQKHFIISYIPSHH